MIHHPIQQEVEHVQLGLTQKSLVLVLQDFQVCTPSCYQLGLVRQLQIIPSQVSKVAYKVEAYSLLSFRLK